MSSAQSILAHGAEQARIVAVDRLDLRYMPQPWSFAAERRSEIERYFAEQQRRRSGMWNGRILMLRDFAIQDGVFRGAFFATDYAAFHAWCHWDFPDRSVSNCFAAGALRGSDGGFLLGVMGDHTANAGQVYFPCGTPDTDDIVADTVDLDGNIRREIAEELGLADGDYRPTPGWTAVLAGPRIALIRTLQVEATADELTVRIRRHLAEDAEPELADIRIARSPGDFDVNMPAFVSAFLMHVWPGRDRTVLPQPDATS